MRAKASEDTKDDVDFIKKMAYDAQNMILDIEKRIQAKDAPSKRQDPIIIPLEPNNSSPNKGNKSANRAIVPQQQPQKLVAEVKKVMPTQRRESEPLVDKKAKEEEERRKREEAKRQFAQNQKKNNKGIEILGVGAVHDD